MQQRDIKDFIAILVYVENSDKRILCGAPQDFSQKGDAKQTNKKSSNKNKN